MIWRKNIAITIPYNVSNLTDETKYKRTGKWDSTVSSESAPSWVNFDSPLTGESAGSANCFLTISHTLSTVSGLAYQGNYKSLVAEISTS